MIVFRVFSKPNTRIRVFLFKFKNVLMEKIKLTLVNNCQSDTISADRKKKHVNYDFKK